MARKPVTIDMNAQEENEANLMEAPEPEASAQFLKGGVLVDFNGVPISEKQKQAAQKSPVVLLAEAAEAKAEAASEKQRADDLQAQLDALKAQHPPGS